jgi:hypothetical protein
MLSDIQINSIIQQLKLKGTEGTAYKDDLLCSLENQAKLAIELERDAARYRFLRDERLSGNISFVSAMGWKPELLYSNEIDLRIDECIASISAGVSKVAS